ncbi:MAG: hypothetical protein WCR07_15670 [Verrucomicrobiota bacterium]
MSPDDPFYVPVYSQPPGTGEPIDRLQRHIEYAEGQSMQFFSGFRGAGKTTELLRLQRRLKEKGCLVVMADASDYINPSAPIDITDLLLVLAGAFGEKIQGATDMDLLHENPWDRFRHFLGKTEVELKEVGWSGGLPGGWGNVDVKAELKDNPSFRQQIQKALAPHLATLKRDTFRYFDEALGRIRKTKGFHDCPIVFIFDSLEQLRGSTSNENDVIRSVESLFSNHLDALRIPGLHLIYTVPPWLKFRLKNLPVELLPSVRQWDNDAVRTPYPPGNDALHDVVDRRFTTPGLRDNAREEILGKDGSRADKRLVENCGGHFRDLLRLLGQCILRAQSLPFAKEVVSDAIESVRSQFLPLATEDALWLDRISRERHPSMRTEDDAGRLARFLDTHLVLYLRTDGEEWYDIHPLVRPEVERIVRLQSTHRPEAS